MPLVVSTGCPADDVSDTGGESDTTSTGDGDGDPTGDGDGDPTGDGDGDPGDGDGDPTGDGDGDPTGDGDGDGDGDVCGDAVIGVSEDCEGDDLKGLTCVELGYVGGELACGEDCSFDESGCYDAVCGDGMKAGGETCDMADFGDDTCETLGYTGGELACGDDCVTDESGCYNAECGNDMIEGPEECDGSDLGGMACVDVGYDGGELGCTVDCTWDIGMCTSCGNDMIEGMEICDGADLGGETCETQGFNGGELGCVMSCDDYDTSNCTQDWWGDDFEGGAQLNQWWALSGNGNWSNSQVMPHAGIYNGESATITHNQQTHMQVALDFQMNGSVTFWRRVSSETNYDYLRFSVDGMELGAWSGVIGWTEQTFPIPAGAHTLRWSYTKDGSVNSNSDKVWVDDITTVGGLLQ